MLKTTAASTPAEYIEALDEPRRGQVGRLHELIRATAQRGYLAESYRDRLPKADIGKSCVRIRRVEDIDLHVMAQLIREGALSTITEQ
ncbi:hypothetical protein BH24CHL6_BH24CHL6_15110 [soil metagenome]